jgi:hypothetical protein
VLRFTVPSPPNNWANTCVTPRCLFAHSRNEAQGAGIPAAGVARNYFPFHRIIYWMNNPDQSLEIIRFWH